MDLIVTKWSRPRRPSLSVIEATLVVREVSLLRASGEMVRTRPPANILIMPGSGVIGEPIT